MGQTATQGTFGNDTAVTRVGQLRTYVQGTSSPVQAASGKVHIHGTSGGCTAAINYARANPANVGALYLVAPFTDVLTFYNDATRVAAAGITQAELNKAYNGGVDDGGTAFLAAMPTHDPSASGNQAALAGIPIRLIYSDDDPVIPPSTVAAYAALLSAAGVSVTTASEGAVGHGSTGVDPVDLVSFFIEHQ